MRSSYYIALLISLWSPVVLLPVDVYGQQVAGIERIVEGRARRVKSTNDAEILRPATRLIKPVVVNQVLFIRDNLTLYNQLWMEVEIDRPGLKGHTILTGTGSYSIESITPDNALRFRLRQGRMSVNLKRGELGVFLKRHLVSILGTEVLILADSARNDTLYLKKGSIRLEEGGPVIEGRNRAWYWSDDGPPVEIVGAALVGLQRRMKYDTRTVWRKPFFKRTGVRLGMLAIVVVGGYYVIQRRDDRPGNVQGQIIIDLPN